MAKILYVASTMQHIRYFHSDYINALKKDGHEVLIMAPDEEADFNVKFEKKMLSLKNLKSIRGMRKLFKENHFDAILLNTTLAAFNVRMALPRKNRPRVVNLMHGYMFAEKPEGMKQRIFLLAEKFVRNKTDAVIVMNSEDLSIAKKYKLTKGEIEYVDGMGATVQAPTESADKLRDELNSVGKYIITFSGEFRGVKNHKQLIEAFAEVKKQAPDTVLWLLGEGVTMQECKELANELGVSDSVHFTGRVKNPVDYLRASDLYVSPSIQEGLPFNVMEALGVGKPIIATELKGHRDLIEDGVTGLLYNKKDTAELVSKILKVYRKEITFDKEKQIKTYDKYSKDSVFEETLITIKRLLKLDK